MTEEITPIAHLLGVGPFSGWFHEKAFLYELYPPLEESGESLVHIVVSCMDADESYGAEAVAFHTDGEGKLNIDYYAEYGDVKTLYGEANPEEVLRRLGYDLVAVRDGVLD